MWSELILDDKESKVQLRNSWIKVLLIIFVYFQVNMKQKLYLMALFDSVSVIIPDESEADKPSEYYIKVVYVS